MGSGGFRIDIGELLKAATQYKAHCDGVQRMLEEWEKAARLNQSTFGNLAVSPKIASEYDNFSDKVSNAVTKFYGSLGTASYTLAVTALRYRAADELTERMLERLTEER